jgi:hypothetical protein
MFSDINHSFKCTVAGVFIQWKSARTKNQSLSQAGKVAEGVDPEGVGPEGVGTAKKKLQKGW